MDNVEIVESVKRSLDLYGRCLSEISSLLMDCKDDADRVEVIAFLMEMIAGHLNIQYDDLMTLEFALRKSQEATPPPA